MTPTPEGPWIQASANFYRPLPTAEMVLVVTNAYSHYPEMEIVLGTSVSATIPAFEKIFVTHGIPQEIKTDNGPPFQGEDFRRFVQEKGFSHRRITPLWPEANGQVKRFMRNVGKIAKTAHISGKDWRREIYPFLTNYQDPPHPSTGKKPYELTMNRVIRTKMHSIIKINIDQSVKVTDMRSKAAMKEYADSKRHTAKTELKVGDTVFVRQPK